MNELDTFFVTQGLVIHSTVSMLQSGRTISFFFQILMSKSMKSKLGDSKLHRDIRYR